MCVCVRVCQHKVINSSRSEAGTDQTLEEIQMGRVRDINEKAANPQREDSLEVFLAPDEREPISR